MLSVLQHDRFLVGADTKTRRNCLLILAKISKFLLTALCCATLALYKVGKWACGKCGFSFDIHLK